MTIEEAIKQLKKCKSFHNGSYGAAINLAIKALEQQHCEDCISREAVKEMLSDEWTKYMPMELDINLSFVMEKINELPSVTPKGVTITDFADRCRECGKIQNELLKNKWIPVSERLPEDYIHVLCQFTLGGMGECYLAHGVFHVVGGLVMTCNEVIAWTPLPEPYMAESEDRK